MIPGREPAFDDRGLVPCIVQDADTDTVLVLAWMTAEALQLTRATRIVHFWSRSRQEIWKKGATSGNTLAVVELRVDCDRDAILVRARPAGPTCHTGATSCFYTVDADGGEVEDAGVPTAANAHVLDRLEATILARRASTADKSYTKSLLAAGMPKILAKIAEEAGELAAELPDGPDAKVVYETADVVFHVMVGLAARGIPIAEVYQELHRRFGTSGHVEKAARPPKPPSET
ncbi:MAG: bifunctional phosphoribosyl-AMP cyclohydrolase/phosphoribosyl-ATP diphosphatase HisIE [Proteobacteria bacterium]|nr:bifunctional phosphoribosyl-AMP cyclohydrolase/phosphoribosyl-ATP diphosphatase HisIE [Pseudomonadota bacterium]